MKAVVEWLLARRHWLAVIAVVSAQVIPVIACALLIVDGARHGPRKALPLAGAVVLAIVVLSVGGGPPATIAMVYALTIGAAGCAAGALIHRMSSLELTFQVLILGTLVVVALVSVLGPAPAVLTAPFIAEVVNFLEAMEVPDGQLDVIRGLDPQLLLSSLYALAEILLLSALMLGYWWLALVDEELHFGKQFRALRLGKIVGILSMVILTASLVLNWPVVLNLAPLVAVGFLFQGIAVMHAWLHGRYWGAIVAGLVYASFVTSLSGITVTALCAAGLLDNFFSLRRSLQTGA